MTAIRVKAHQGNIERYRKLLAGRLSQVEREYIMRRIADERVALNARPNHARDKRRPQKRKEGRA